jgi:hypothetical protein
MTQEFLRNKGGRKILQIAQMKQKTKKIGFFFGEILDEKRKFVLITFLPRERENGTDHFEKRLDL